MMRKLVGGIAGLFGVFTVCFGLEAFQVPDQPLADPLDAKSGLRKVTPDWLLTMPNVDLEIPSVGWLDETHLVCAFPTVEEYQWKIEIVDVCNGGREFLIEGESPKASPDGQWIAFARGRDEEKQLWIMSRDGKNLRQLFRVDGGLGISEYSYSFAWSPDSRQIALNHRSFVEPWQEVKSENHIELIDILTGGFKRIATFEKTIRSLTWMPNGEEVLFMKEHVGMLWNTKEDYTWIQAVNVKNGSVRTLAYFEGLQQALDPISSPDGKFVVFAYDADNPCFTFMPSIGFVRTDCSNDDELPVIRRLTYEMKLGQPQWAKSSNLIYALRRFAGYNQIYSFDIETGKAVQITSGPQRVGVFALSPNGNRLAWIGKNAHGSYITQVSDNCGQGVRDLISISHAPEDMALSEVREISWNVPDYPVPMRGLLFLPLNYEEGKRYPLIVDIHGGDHGASIKLQGGILTSTVLEWHMWAAKGYAVFVPEFRSSASFGSLAITRDHFRKHDSINCDIIDIEAGVDELIKSGIVDEDRLAAIGFSAGAKRVNWLAVATHRYRAVISHDGCADEWMEAFYYPPMRRAELAFGGTPWDVPQNYLKNSALFYSAGATTPALFLIGNVKMGGIDSAGTSRMLYHALKGQGVESQYIEYADEGHTFEKLENRRDALMKSVEWIDSHLEKTCNN